MSRFESLSDGNKESDERNRRLYRWEVYVVVDAFRHNPRYAEFGASVANYFIALDAVAPVFDSVRHIIIIGMLLIALVGLSKRQYENVDPDPRSPWGWTFFLSSVLAIILIICSRYVRWKIDKRLLSFSLYRGQTPVSFVARHPRSCWNRFELGFWYFAYSVGIAEDLGKTLATLYFDGPPWAIGIS